MCTPKTPKVEKTPVRQAGVLPDNGNSDIATMNRERRRLGPSAMIFAGANGTLGAPTTTSTLGS